uniref:AN1-type domain-containing protein n=1 Tax=Anopheles epiroticus TaxID=199890 RepID=A0A182NZD2_9DIPT
MWTPSYDIIVETLTGSEFEVTVNDRDTVGYLKLEIQKYEGIPTSQQHLLYNHKELSDTMEMKDIPLVKGSRVKLVLGMKGGPISSKRLFTISSDYDNWLDMSDVLSGEDLMNLQSPGLKLLLYKDNKKNVHRLMKVRAEKACDGMKGSMSSRSMFGNGASDHMPYGLGGPMSQKEREAAVTKQKMDEIKAKLSLKKKRLGGVQVDKAVDNRNPGSSTKSQAPQITDPPGSCSNDIGDAGSKAIRNSNHIRHKKRHNRYLHHQHQHETVIKEEKTPIGFRPGAGSSGGGGGGATALIAGGHNASMVGTIGSMLPSAGTTNTPHRKSMPAVIDIGRPEQEQAVPPFGYGYLLHGAATTTTGRSPTLEMEKRSQIREHLQRNRSFKTISAKNLDFARESSAQTGAGGLSDRHGGSAGLERSLSFHSNGIMTRMGSETTLDTGYSNIRRCTAAGGGQLRSNHTGLGTCMSGVGGGGGACTTQSLHKLDESRVSSTSLHDLIELLKYSQSKQRTISNDSLNKLMLNYSKKVYVPHHLYHHVPQAGKKSLPEINPSLNNIDEYVSDYDYGLKASSGTATTAATTTASAAPAGAIPKMMARSEDGLDCKIASAEYAFKNASMGGMDKSFRTLYKSTSDDSSVYELPKLLIREDSPVESFLDGYSQLETVAATRRGESPKNNFTSTTSLQDVDEASAVDPATQLRPLAAANATAAVVSETKLASESLLQLAQIAAESVKSSNATGTSLSSSSLFGSNNSLTGAAVGGSDGDGVICAPDTALGGSISAAWCQHWNHRQQQQPQQQQHDVPYTTASLQHLDNPRRHHSELGINELELKFFHTDVDTSDRVARTGSGSATNGSGDYTNLIKLPAISNLGASNGWLQLSSWDTVRFGREDEDADDEEALDEQEVADHEEEDHEEEENGEEEEEDDDVDNGQDQDQDRVTSSSCSSIQRPRESSNSTSFIHSHLSISSDEDDLLNVAEMRRGVGVVGSAYKPGGNKSKSIDLNEFRKAFGSSPTLLNGFRGGTSCTRLVPQLSRLETIPSQYRRGYTNLNDACLSSSTSELECVSNGAAKKKHQGLLPPTCDDTNVLSSTLLKYRKDGSVPYVRSNENLNRYKVSLCAGSIRRRIADSDETLDRGDALYLRQRQHSVGGSRHLPSIRDHLASIADSEANDTVDVAGNTTRMSGADENGNANRSFVVGGDLECRFSRLSCCSALGGDGPTKPTFSPGGNANRTATGTNYRPKEHSTVVGSNRGGLMRTTSSASTDDRCRFLFGEDATSLPYNGSTSSTPLRPSDYYFPSDESLFNMDSFFDDFVEIDTSDIFESSDFININSGSEGNKKSDSKSGRGGSAGLVLPDIHSEQHQQQSQQLLNQKHQHASFPADQLRVSGSMKAYSTAGSEDARNQYYRAVNGQPDSSGGANVNGNGGEIHYSARRAFLQAGQSVQDVPEGIASVIQHIDRDQLCEQRSPLPDATVASSIFIHDSKERLLRLTDHPSDHRKPAIVATSPTAEPQHHTTEQIKSKKLRCAQCNKKLGVIMIMKCHCEKIFCAQHRYAEAHNCSFDFKVEGRKVLEKNNPLVVADKLPKI